MNYYFSFVYLDGCKNSPYGKLYLGQRNLTWTGLECQRWDSQSPNQHRWNKAEDFPDETLYDAANYCRNPDTKSGGPWCYTTNPNKTWEYCDVPFCRGG